MLIQVRVIDEEHEQDLEDSVNDFLDDLDPHNFIDIKYSINAFLSSTGEQIYCYSALIVYRVEEKHDGIVKKERRYRFR